MSSEYVVLSFFKSNRIHYHYEKPTIIFPCPHCGLEAKMNARIGLWKCEGCLKQGTLVTLMEMMDTDGKEQRLLQHVKIYNPKEEYQLIKRSFERLIEVHGDRVEKLYKRVEKLIDYHQEEKQRRN